MSPRIAALRQIVADRQYAKVDGVLVDLWTAQAVVACYEAGSDRTRRIIETAPLEKVVALALHLLTKR
jgi:hypothetical protein